MTTINSTWVELNKNIESLLEHQDVTKFLQWKPIGRTMVHSNCHKNKLNWLQNNSWNIWEKAIQEDAFGGPIPYLQYPKSSGNLILHAYNFSQLRPTGNVKDIKSIFEFGGGYGSLCRLIHRLGFKGTYTIYDLPTCLKLQDLFLSNINLSDVKINKDKICEGEGQINLIEKLPEPMSVDLFIATWSLSETPILMRETILKAIDFKECLISFYNDWGGINNDVYFKQLIKDMPQYNWTLTPAADLPSNYYLIGRKK